MSLFSVRSAHENQKPNPFDIYQLWKKAELKKMAKSQKGFFYILFHFQKMHEIIVLQLFNLLEKINTYVACNINHVLGGWKNTICCSCMLFQISHWFLCMSTKTQQESFRIRDKFSLVFSKYPKWKPHNINNIAMLLAKRWSPKISSFNFDGIIRRLAGLQIPKPLPILFLLIHDRAMVSQTQWPVFFAESL